MLYHKAIEDWPEKVGQPIACQNCGEAHTLDECLSVIWTKEPEEGTSVIQVRCMLVCMTCIVSKGNPAGRA